MHFLHESVYFVCLCMFFQPLVVCVCISIIVIEYFFVFDQTRPEAEKKGRESLLRYLYDFPYCLIVVIKHWFTAVLAKCSRRDKSSFPVREREREREHGERDRRGNETRGSEDRQTERENKTKKGKKT